MRALLLAPLISAAAVHAAAPRAAAALDVPFFPDGSGQCGPTALASVLRYWGDSARPGELRDQIYRGDLKGSLPVDLLLAARARGLSARILEGSLDELKRELDAGHPVIAFVNVGLRAYPVGHYLVLTGYDEARRLLYAHSGTQKDALVPYGRFERQWRNAERWALLVLPPGR
ncbi:MAG TPA: C39 family peptidase [Elusimicrobiota bacterium]|nr:C39 family peptidase [Elusimicrobiota bacterium]